MEALLGLYRPEDKVKQLERKVTQLVEESCFASDRGELQLVRMTDCSVLTTVNNSDVTPPVDAP